jgi:hypothetical protein
MQFASSEGTFRAEIQLALKYRAVEHTSGSMKKLRAHYKN